MATLTEYLNTLYTTTWAKRRPTTVDQVIEENKLLLLMKSKGMIKYEATDGRRLEIPLRVKKPLLPSSLERVRHLPLLISIH